MPWFFFWAVDRDASETNRHPINGGGSINGSNGVECLLKKYPKG
ncbi:hypothetical protein OAH00_00775 [bacterium]|nr:hypothetical protein [bacterium]